MCGRFSLTKEEAEIEKRFNARFYSNDLVKRYNVAPSQLALVITDKNPSELQLYKWGLIPSWAKDISIGNKIINARSETLREKPSFRNLIKRKRCLVISDGFYEWKKYENGSKTPYRICLKDEGLFSFAGLWDSWTDENTGEIIDSFTIITTSANSKVAPIHDRMPVILEQEEEKIWLNMQTDPVEIDSVLDQFSVDNIKVYQVSKLVNSPVNDNSGILNPIEEV